MFSSEVQSGHESLRLYRLLLSALEDTAVNLRILFYKLPCKTCKKGLFFIRKKKKLEGYQGKKGWKESVCALTAG